MRHCVTANATKPLLPPHNATIHNVMHRLWTKLKRGLILFLEGNYRPVRGSAACWPAATVLGTSSQLKGPLRRRMPQPHPSAPHHQPVDTLEILEGGEVDD